MSDFSFDCLIIDAARPDFELNDAQCEYLISSWDDCIETLDVIISPNQMNVAGSHFCAAVNIPSGSYWMQVIAAFMDSRPEINGDNRLELLNGVLAEKELIDPVETAR